MPQSPQMSQWQQRFDAANRAISQATTPAQREAAIQNLRHIQTVKPTGPSVATGQAGRLSTPKPTQRSSGIFGAIADAMRNANGG